MFDSGTDVMPIDFIILLTTILICWIIAFSKPFVKARKAYFESEDIFMAKNDELEAVGLIRQMATQSLSPDDFEDLERCLDTLIKTRHLD